MMKNKTILQSFSHFCTWWHNLWTCICSWWVWQLIVSLLANHWPHLMDNFPFQQGQSVQDAAKLEAKYLVRDVCIFFSFLLFGWHHFLLSFNYYPSIFSIRKKSFSFNLSLFSSLYHCFALHFSLDFHNSTLILNFHRIFVFFLLRKL